MTEDPRKKKDEHTKTPLRITEIECEKRIKRARELVLYCSNGGSHYGKLVFFCHKIDLRNSSTISILMLSITVTPFHHQLACCCYVFSIAQGNKDDAFLKEHCFLKTELSSIWE
ncbi:hypothetical protein CEXT_672721 [Caerostris extrusa]|uniref:Uncharacterized protein n=1 Tax=Caerostris extrusa TaxID=172846 RepID=A0AAV4QVA0_CAEEX|nr:hypothetical protein CEXT_672721 [Caerostris extrusa]